MTSMISLYYYISIIYTLFYVLQHPQLLQLLNAAMLFCREAPGRLNSYLELKQWISVIVSQSGIYCTKSLSCHSFNLYCFQTFYRPSATLRKPSCVRFPNQFSVSSREPVDEVLQMPPSLLTCGGCQQSIGDRFFLKAIEQYWHEDCLSCDLCGCRLGEVGRRLYYKLGRKLCRRDYLRSVCVTTSWLSRAACWFVMWRDHAQQDKCHKRVVVWWSVLSNEKKCASIEKNLSPL